MTKKVRHPDEDVKVSVGGKAIDPDADGIFEVEDHHAHELVKAHKFEEVDEEADAKRLADAEEAVEAAKPKRQRKKKADHKHDHDHNHDHKEALEEEPSFTTFDHDVVTGELHKEHGHHHHADKTDE